MATEKWTEAELDASVKVYLEMLSKERDGIFFRKSDYRNQLLAGALKGRTPGSFEFRMQNISYVLDSHGEPYIKGYLPAKNVGTNTIDSIVRSLERNMFIFQSDRKPTADDVELEQRTKRLRKIIDLNKRPIGQQVPKKLASTTTVYYRDPEIKAWVLECANGRCEACGAGAPFLLPDGNPYLEVHHMIPLAQGGPDIIENAVALCPNCHRKVHLSLDANLFNAEIYTRVKRLTK